MRHTGPLLTLLLALGSPPPSHAQPLDPALHHLRYGLTREWDDFPAQPEANQLRLTFTARTTDGEKTLRLRHRDLRHPWLVRLNGKEIGRLGPEDNATVSLIPVPQSALREGRNELAITCAPTSADVDDVSIGGVDLLDIPRAKLVSQSSVEVTVTDADTHNPIPSRLTIVDQRGFLAPLGVESAGSLAVRPGAVYTATGRATLRLPAGSYVLYAGRGFEWGVATQQLALNYGDNPPAHLSIRREADTPGLVACDTHVHTFTYSRHGDATLAERMITLAGEGIDLPVATDHNLPVDYEDAARAARVRQYFTPVVGNEVTTPKLGHFNVFPVERAAPLIDFRAPTWDKLFAGIDANAPGAVVILNHARDQHGGYRPFDPTRHLAVVGQRVDGQVLRANAMEVLNSGATLNDPLLLYRDWIGCLNRGLRLTPVGASDSHDVTRYIVGQARTYIAADDSDPGTIDVARACDALKRGRVCVSYGLLAQIKVNGRAGPGDTLRADGDHLDVEVTVSGPAWTRADRVELHANGATLRAAAIDPADGAKPGVKFAHTWRIPRPAHDVRLTAVALGPGVTQPYWPVARPYQRTSSHWTPYVFACTGTVNVDADGSGRFECAFDYARRIVDQTHGDPGATVAALAGYDAAVAAQAASVLRDRRVVTTPAELEALARQAPTDAVRDGLNDLAVAWRASTPPAPPSAPHDK